MADDKKVKKGMRTFASDLERAKTKKKKLKPEKKVVATISEQETTVKQTKPEPKPAPKKVEAPASKAPAKIPAFHELQKQVDAVVKQEEKNETAPKDTHRKTSSKLAEPIKPVGGGTIITDTKDGSFDLLPEIGKSVTGWFSGIKKKRKKAPKLSIPETSLRKGVIQEATTKTGTIFTADSETLKERIKARKRAEKQKPDEPETIWTPNTEPGFDLLAGEVEKDTTTPKAAAPKDKETLDNTSNVAVSFKKRTVPIPAPKKPEAKSKAAEPTPVTIAPPAVKKSTPEPKPVTKTPKVAEVKEVETEAPPVEHSPTITLTPTPESPTIVTTPPPPAIENEELKLPVEAVEAEEDGVSTNMLTLYIIGILIGLGILGMLGYLIYNAYTNQAQADETTATEYVRNATLETITVDATFNPGLITQKAADSTLGTHEFVLRNSDMMVLPTALVFELVTPELPTSIQQHVTDVRFVTVDRSDPLVYVLFTNLPAVQGEMFIHEDLLADAFATLYPAPTTPATYKDDQVAGVDVRSLTNELGDAFLTYGFVDENTLVIAGSIESFATFVRN